MQKVNKQWVLFFNNQLVVKKENESYLIPCFDKLPDWINQTSTLHFIGQYNEKESYTLELTEPIHLPENYTWVTLKAAVDLLGENFTIAARAMQILLWDKNHQHCGRCGGLTVCKPELFERRCESCKLFFYPRISPSIIVMIKKENQILMARKPQFAPSMYALIAGFVEAGESVEEAVHREVAEEVNIKVKNIRYFGSQAWPFPDSLMLAFIADYEGGEINLNDSELEAANWYEAHCLPGSPAAKNSIASQLINHFIQNQV